MTGKEELERLRDVIDTYIEDESAEVEALTYSVDVETDDSDPTDIEVVGETFDVYRLRVEREYDD